MARLIAILVLTGALAGMAAAQKVDRSVPATSQNPKAMALGEDEVKQLILMMDTSGNGKISKQEFMSFMEAEFDRLDRDKSGELDVNELKHSRMRAARSAVGK